MIADPNAEETKSPTSSPFGERIPKVPFEKRKGLSMSSGCGQPRTGVVSGVLPPVEDAPVDSVVPSEELTPVVPVVLSVGVSLVLPCGDVVEQVVVPSDDGLPGVVEPGGLAVLGVALVLPSSEVDVVEPPVARVDVGVV